MDVLQWLKEQSRRLNEYADRKLAAAERRLAEVESRSHCEARDRRCG